MLGGGRPGARVSIATIRDFLRHEATAGLLLMATAALALVLDNSPLSSIYDKLIATPVVVQVGEFEIDKPLLLWINDGLMAVFFMLVGLEIKREVLEGELSSRSQIMLPGIAALGGMVVPAAVYATINWEDPILLNGWAIPAATDIAFALGILALLGSRVPVALKLFLLALAIIDDLGAIIIIAVYYTADLSLASLAVAGVGALTLFLLNRFGVLRLAPYILVGVVIAGIVGVGDIRVAWSFSAFTVLIYYAVTNLAALAMPAEERLYPRTISVLGLIACLLLAFFVERTIWEGGRVDD